MNLGGFKLNGNPEGMVSAKTGFAEPYLISTDPKEALAEVDVLFIDIPADDYENRFGAIAPSGSLPAISECSSRTSTVTRAVPHRIPIS